ARRDAAFPRSRSTDRVNSPTMQQGETTPATRHPSFGEALRFWLKLGFISFGGPTGQIAIMHTELVEKRRWIGEGRFLHALNFCMLLPGPEAQQLATYCGWLLHRTWGGIAAGVLFVLPSALLLWALGFVYVTYGEVRWVAAIFEGLKPAVLAIVVAAVLRIGSKALRNAVMWGIAAAAFVAIYFFGAPFPAIVIAALVLGALGGRFRPSLFPAAQGHGSAPASVIDDSHDSEAHTRPTLARAIRVIGVCLVLWWTPILAAGLFQGWDGTLFKQGIFFSKAAMVTFGGAYAVLPYVAQQAVEVHAWLAPAQMLDGLGLAETTPGPLIMVLQFVGFMGGWNHPGAMTPLLAATLGAAITTWVTFVPCFLWIFLGAPHIEQLRGRPAFNSALAAVTAAVVGVILNLAVWFGGHILFPGGVVAWFSVAIAVAAFAAMQWLRVGIIPVVLGAGAVGLLASLF
ncbi:MAG TPA: chromate efflux transporter, partial [Opitutaceae bacterium]|nr:chromate efflux transporter [Opitutaceae bacterium]